MGAQPIIRMGDPTSHGGHVVEGHPNTSLYGKPIAGVGHMTYCPKCKGQFPIVQGVRIHTMMGKNTAVHGMKTACGAVLIATQGTATIDDEPGPNERLFLDLRNGSAEPEKRPYDERVRIKDKDGKPIANIPYYITDGSGNKYKGVTDENGCCDRVYTKSAETLKILTCVPALEKW